MPAASGALAEVPVCCSVQDLRRSVVTWSTSKREKSLQMDRHEGVGEGRQLENKCRMAAYRISSPIRMTGTGPHKCKHPTRGEGSMRRKRPEAGREHSPRPNAAQLLDGVSREG